MKKIYIIAFAFSVLCMAGAELSSGNSKDIPVAENVQKNIPVSTESTLDAEHISQKESVELSSVITQLMTQATSESCKNDRDNPFIVQYSTSKGEITNDETCSQMAANMVYDHGTYFQHHTDYGNCGRASQRNSAGTIIRRSN